MMRRHFTATALLFDLDGVLADSTQAVNRSWEAWAVRHGLDPQLAIANGHGRPSIEAIRITAPHLNAAESFAEMEALEESFIESVIAVDGAARFVQKVCELRVPWAVVTSGTRRIAIPRLQRAGIPEPRVLVTADDVDRGKPDPQPYAKAAQLLGMDPWECIVFEDAPAGMLSARRAGATVIAIAAEETTRADAAVRDFEDARIAADSKRLALELHPSRWRCPCCFCHTLRAPNSADRCTLCLWNEQEAYDLAKARENVQRFAVAFAPTDRRFANARHPILGPNGEPAIDRVALRTRAYREFSVFGEKAGERAHLTQRLESILAAVCNGDSLYERA